ncbi:heterokaryon incompatibility protein-domain-containing protein [Xylaria scruposa]|nr:heterokaryon incompatibility protein-domain-containing protein [Xylaria scruposa]
MRLTTEARVKFCYGRGANCNRTELVLSDGEERFEIFIIPVAEVDDEPDFAQSTSTSQSLDLATRWFRTCDKSHPACMADNTKAYPSRLLSLSSDVLHLVHSSEIPDRPRYATLSHCWGTLELLKLRKENYGNFLVEIEESELCRTFRDTIRIVKHLGLEYLWIDSLCIVQNDTEDWIRESARMCDIYGGSSINIAATSARDGSFGCFFDRDEKTLRKIRKIRVPLSAKTQLIVASEDIYHNVESGPLTHRAWAFQERLLAHRTLSFTNSQLFWECETILACETFPDKLPEDYCWEYKMPKFALSSYNREKPIGQDATTATDHKRSSDASHRRRRSELRTFLYYLKALRPRSRRHQQRDTVIAYEMTRPESKISLAGFLLPDQSLLRLWGYIVENYSKAKLTKPTDKLVALSGVAKWLQDHKNDVYLAGLWRRGLEIQLCWTSYGSVEESFSLAGPAEYVAPSWSWASTNREIMFKAKSMDSRFQKNVRVLSTDVKQETIEAPLGRVLYGALCLSFCKLHSQLLFPGNGRTTLDLDYPIRETTLAYFLPIYTRCSDDLTVGIVLESVQSDGKIFRRIGGFFVDSCSLDDLGAEVVDYSRFREDGKNLYTLTIV